MLKGQYMKEGRAEFLKEGKCPRGFFWAGPNRSDCSFHKPCLLIHLFVEKAIRVFNLSKQLKAAWQKYNHTNHLILPFPLFQLRVFTLLERPVGLKPRAAPEVMFLVNKRVSSGH